MKMRKKSGFNYQIIFETDPTDAAAWAIGKERIVEEYGTRFTFLEHIQIFGGNTMIKQRDEESVAVVSNRQGAYDELLGRLEAMGEGNALVIDLPETVTPAAARAQLSSALNLRADPRSRIGYEVRLTEKHQLAVFKVALESKETTHWLEEAKII